MRYIDFREQIRKALTENPGGLTWLELKNKLDLPYDQPCQTWINLMEQEIGLVRAKEGKRAYTWRINRVR